MKKLLFSTASGSELRDFSPEKPLFEVCATVADDDAPVDATGPATTRHCTLC